MQSQQLLTESEIFKGEVRSGTESTDNPSQEMSERRDDGQNHDQNLIEIRRIKLVCKSFIPRLHEVLTRDTRRIYAFTITPHSSLHRWQYRAPQGSLPLLGLSRISLLLRLYSAAIPCVLFCVFHLSRAACQQVALTTILTDLSQPACD